MPKRYPAEQHEQAVKMVLDHLYEYRSLHAACQAIGPKIGIGPEIPVDLDRRLRSALPSSPAPPPLSISESRNSNVRTEISRK